MLSRAIDLAKECFSFIFELAVFLFALAAIYMALVFALALGGNQ